MKKLTYLVFVTGIQRPNPIHQSLLVAGAHSDDCAAPGDGDDDGGGSDCPEGV
jgi:hypothetical protein